MDWVVSSLRETQPRPRPLQRKVPTKANSLHRAGFCRGEFEVRPMLDALDGTALARVSLCPAKAVRQQHRMSFVRSTRHALHIFCQTYNALEVAHQVVPTTRPLSLILRELRSFSTSPQLFYSHRMDAAAKRDAIMSTQEENWRVSSTGW